MTADRHAERHAQSPAPLHRDHEHDQDAAGGPGFCARCGARLREPGAPGEPPVCRSCGLVRYENPKLAAGVVVEHEGAILLVRRNHEPMYGRWSFPSGFVERGEVVEEAGAPRGTRGDRPRGRDRPPARRLQRRRRHGRSFVAYAGHSSGGVPEPGPEAIEVGLFPSDELPELAFAHDPAIVEAWRRATRAPDP